MMHAEDDGFQFAKPAIDILLIPPMPLKQSPIYMINKRISVTIPKLICNMTFILIGTRSRYLADICSVLKASFLRHRDFLSFVCRNESAGDR